MDESTTIAALDVSEDGADDGGGAEPLKLTRATLPKADLDLVDFEVDWAGVPAIVKIRAMTVKEWHMLLRTAFDLVVDNGDGPTYERRQEFYEPAYVVARCTYGDDGDLLFGDTPHEAERYLGQLGREYSGGISQLHSRILDLSGITGGGNAAVEEAEKN